MSPSLHIGPPQVEQCFQRLGIDSRFTDTEAARLETVTVETGAGFLTFPTPEDNEALTILNLRQTLGTDPKIQPIFFDHPWYLDEPFARHRCDPGWHSLARTVLPESVGQPIYYADSIKRAALYLPSATEVALMLFLVFHLTGERLLLRKHTWTRDRTESKRFVSVGAFGGKGLFVSSHEIGYQSRGLGICPMVDPVCGVRA